MCAACTKWAWPKGCIFSRWNTSTGKTWILFFGASDACPRDKAVELTRKICAGLSAAHERGVLHRDLKPSNIMIDGRGQPRITDFGLAALAQEIPLSDLRSGTPAYMSPEQKAGHEVTIRSDVYSLGLVLHEMFTGKSRRDTRSTPSELVKELDPVIERVILRCLEEDPKRRPASALSVAIALPGGDPIAAALAAGETPSPEMVAASQEKEGFSPSVAWACFGAVLVLLAVAAAIHGRLDLQTRAPLDIPQDALAFRARTILQQLGYPQKPVDTAYGIDCCDSDFLMSVRSLDPARRNALLATHQPAVIRFWYRQHTGLFYADSFLTGSSIPPGADLTGNVTYESPANLEPGMVRMQLSPKGDLVALEARPPSAEADWGVAHAVDWSPLLAAAGLEASRLLPVQPLRVPPMAFDTRAAWIGTYAAGRSEQVRVEAASWQGRAVSFNLRGDWQKDAEFAPTISRFAVSVMFGVAIALLSAGVLLARRNLRQGRGDRRGAAWVATLIFSAALASWIPTAHHVPAAWEMGLLVKALCQALFMAAAGAVSYLAIEPFARRFWPDAFISLTRLQAGRYRDPLVASHILGGIVAALAFVIFDVSATRLVEGRDTIFLPLIDALGSPGYATGMLLFNVARAIITPLVVLVLLVLLRQITRRTWLAYILSVIVMAAVIVPYGSIYVFPAMRAERLVAAAIPFALLHRWGLLAFISYQFVLWLSSFPLAPAVWYGGQTFLLLAVPAALAAWALWVVLSDATTPLIATGRVLP